MCNIYSTFDLKNILLISQLTLISVLHLIYTLSFDSSIKFKSFKIIINYY